MNNLVANVFHSPSSHFFDDIAKVQKRIETTKFPPFIRSQISHDFCTFFFNFRKPKHEVLHEVLGEVLHEVLHEVLKKLNR